METLHTNPGYIETCSAPCSELCVDNTYTELVTSSIGAPCNARPYFLIGRENIRGFSYESAESFTWTQTDSGDTNLCPPGGDTGTSEAGDGYVVGNDIPTSLITLTATLSDNGGQAWYGHYCEIDSVHCDDTLINDAVVPAFDPSDLTCWGSVDSDITMTCIPVNYVGKLDFASYALTVPAFGYWTPTIESAYAGMYGTQDSSGIAAYVDDWARVDWSSGTLSTIVLNFNDLSANIEYSGTGANAYGYLDIAVCTMASNHGDWPGDTGADWDAFWADATYSSCASATGITSCSTYFTCDSTTYTYEETTEPTSSTTWSYTVDPSDSGAYHIFVVSVCSGWGLCLDRFDSFWLAAIPQSLPTGGAEPALTDITQNEALIDFVIDGTALASF